MVKAQGLPVNMIVLTALALLVLVVVGAFFISGFGQASSSVNIVNATQADCQSICQGLVSSAYNYDECVGYDSNTGEYTGFGATSRALEYVCTCADNYGGCTVTLRDGSSCMIAKSTYEIAKSAKGQSEKWETTGDGTCAPFVKQ